MHRQKKAEPVSTDGSVQVTAQASPRFDITTQKAECLAFLEEYGYAVVASVADGAAIERSKALMWDWLEETAGEPLSRDDPETWKKRWLPDSKNGIMNGYGFGQSDFMWSVRLLPKVKEAFAAIWKTDDLLVSYDGGNAFRPWRYDRAWLTDGGWYHVDQNANRPNRTGKVCIQGLVTLCDADETTGGLVLVPGSHQNHTEWCERNPLGKVLGDFLPADVHDEVFEGGARLVCAKAGDLILWDSRTIHCNTPALTAPSLEEERSRPPSLPPSSGGAVAGDGGEGGHGGGIGGTTTPMPSPSPQPPSASASDLTMTPAPLNGGGATALATGPTEFAELVAGPPATPPSSSGEKWSLIRQVAYVCMTPAALAPPDVLLKRQQGFVQNASTGHWPHVFKMAGRALTTAADNDPTAISPEQRALIGYDRGGPEFSGVPLQPANNGIKNCTIL